MTAWREALAACIEHGNTVVVIEHNLDVIKTADWILDLGPEGGVKGGEIVVEGTPNATGAVAGAREGAGLWRRSNPDLGKLQNLT